jgi:hypothetical protein
MRRLSMLLLVLMDLPLVGQEPWFQRVIDQDIDVPIPVDSCQVRGRALQLLPAAGAA